MLNFIRQFFSPSEKINLEERGVFVLADKILELQDRIEKLEYENIGLINDLYECENRMEAKIDNIHPVIYNISERKDSLSEDTLHDYSLGEK